MIKQTFFTSDTHFRHNNILKYCNRPFKNTDDMDKQIIKNWNSKINPNDDVYFLGDFTLSNNIEYIENILSQLNGNIYVIKGNHDKGVIKYFNHERQNKDEKDWLIKEIYDYLQIKINNKTFVLFHYPIEDWAWSSNSIHLHGHLHGEYKLHNHNVQKHDLKNRLDIGIDTNNLFPYSFDDVIAKLEYLYDI